MNSDVTALLYSGGLDSGILLADMAARGAVVPIYIDGGLAWQPAEWRAAVGFARRVAAGRAVSDPVRLALPVCDLYGTGHWSVGGAGVPDAASPDAAVYLPGRNPLLAVKPLVWCSLRGIRRLALATLAGNPFADATPSFREALSATMSQALGHTVELIAPFSDLTKREVMLRGRSLPLEETLSCIAPTAGDGRGLHCGRCNKCGERQRAFRDAGFPDATRYAS
jgi:7-cyano-7-deazaguanine synthase